MMRIHLTSLLVDDQDKALDFYTRVLRLPEDRGPVGCASLAHRRLPEDPDGTELVPEPDTHPAVKPFEAALSEGGIPFTSFAVDDVHAEFQRLRRLGCGSPRNPWSWAL